MSDAHEPRRGFPAQSMPWTVQDLNQAYREDGADDWPLPVSGDATAWAARGDDAAWAAMVA